MAKYVDGYVIVVPKNKLAAYQKMAKKGSKIWMKYGALEYFETVAHDMNCPGMVPFPKLAKAKSNETIIFAWVVYKSKSQRDQVNKKVMNDPYMQNFDMSSVPFNPKRMSYGGFKVIVEGK